MAAERVWESVKVEGPDSAGVATLTLHRPSRFNALNPSLFQEIPAAIRALDMDPAVRVVILNAAGQHFCSGIDLSFFTTVVGSDASTCLGRQREKFRRDVKDMQDAFTAFEECRKPVIAAIHGACIGGGIDMVTACDLRYCTENANFSVKEVDVAITADLGTLQRLPKLIGHGSAMELALTGRHFSGPEAKSLGLVQGVLPSKTELDAYVQKIASQIAAKSPLAVMGTKAVLIKSRDMSVAQGLDYVGLWNAAMLVSEDLEEAALAKMQKRTPKFSKL
ncbi:delta(3,5)-Delta(2,4)-dienoyl-CoA isomerase, peroxisomal [Physcomitrium patens]|uniref:Uncharacterized protein n=1 Tax=Physcomitrium patens TaxID=3218 RepID=A9SW38_PHYPA|nr:delta(3,5)-Delta(2,4)-dienoyl-CoA isomerase, peroxisomal-like [Physcomitrium patens]PNR37305.1 hypothetical protein PHYPA_020413 [Physcomitrium patens]|eukprot:XP_024399333.1 delta(3,5)-Delta(2,4)-dienoyl-CoA isomerase, peroxisomal-like [Physcomitrella patens]